MGHEPISARTALNGFATPLAELLALVPHGVILVGNRLKVLYANQRAVRFLATGKGLAIEQGRFRLDDPSSTATLGRLLLRARRLPPGAIAGAWLVPRLSGTGRPLTLAVSAQRLTTVHGPAAVAAIHLVDPDGDRAVPESLLRQLYGLTKREARLATALVQGRAPRAAAAELDISVGTARNHLKRIFLKTGTSGQADLMRLLLATSSALCLDAGTITVAEIPAAGGRCR